MCIEQPCCESCYSQPQGDGIKEGAIEQIPFYSFVVEFFNDVGKKVMSFFKNRMSCLLRCVTTQNSMHNLTKHRLNWIKSISVCNNFCNTFHSKKS